MFLTAEQVDQLDQLCEKIAGNRTRTGRVIIEIRNNHPRNFLEENPVYDADLNLIGYTTQVHRARLPKEEIAKARQNNRIEGKTGEVRNE